MPLIHRRGLIAGAAALAASPALAQGGEIAVKTLTCAIRDGKPLLARDFFRRRLA